jgi:hypothetical protein
MSQSPQFCRHCLRTTRRYRTLEYQEPHAVRRLHWCADRPECVRDYAAYLGYPSRFRPTPVLV